MKVYTSPYATKPFPDESIYTFLFQTRFDDHACTGAAFIDAASGQIVTRRELKAASLSLAHGLRTVFTRMGGVPLQRGDVVMVLSPNSVAFPVAMMGGLAAGLCVVLGSPAFTPRELEHQWTDARTKAAMVHPACVPTVLKMFEQFVALS